MNIQLFEERLSLIPNTIKFEIHDLLTKTTQGPFERELVLPSISEDSVELVLENHQYYEDKFKLQGLDQDTANKLAYRYFMITRSAKRKGNRCCSVSEFSSLYKGFKSKTNFNIKTDKFRINREDDEGEFTKDNLYFVKVRSKADRIREKEEAKKRWVAYDLKPNKAPKAASVPPIYITLKNTLIGLGVSEITSGMMAHTYKYFRSNAKAKGVQVMTPDEWVSLVMDSDYLNDPDKYKFVAKDKSKGYTLDNIECRLIKTKEQLKQEIKDRVKERVEKHWRTILRKSLIAAGSTPDNAESLLIIFINMTYNSKKENVPCLTSTEFAQMIIETGHQNDIGRKKDGYKLLRIDTTKGFVRDNFEFVKYERYKLK